MSSTALTLLTARLAADVPARNSVPSADQYERAVKDAVVDFSGRAGRVKVAYLSMVAGVATYSLAADLVQLISIDMLFTPLGLVVTDQGIIPTNPNYEERWTVADGSITFYPTPNYSLTRYYEYLAGWVAAGSPLAYQEFGDREAGIVLRLAASKVLALQADRAAQEAWQYAIGDERVNKEKLASALRAQSTQALAEYLKAAILYSAGGMLGMRAMYTRGAYE